MPWLRRIVALVAAIAATAVLGCLASTHFVLFGLTELGARISFADRLYAYGHDVAGMAPLFGSLVTVGFLIAFPVAALIVRFLPRLRTWGYAAAGAAAILVILLSMEMTLAAMPVAGARTPLGLAVQGFAGAVGGLVFAQISADSQRLGNQGR